MLGLLHHSHGRCFETAHPVTLAKGSSTEWVVALERGASLVVKPRLTWVHNSCVSTSMNLSPLAKDSCLRKTCWLRFLYPCSEVLDLVESPGSTCPWRCKGNRLLWFVTCRSFQFQHRLFVPIFRNWTSKLAILGYQNQEEMPGKFQICW